MHARFGWNGKSSGELGHLRRKSVDPFHVACAAGNGTPLGHPQRMFLIFESGRSENPSRLALGSGLQIIMEKGRSDHHSGLSYIAAGGHYLTNTWTMPRK